MNRVTGITYPAGTAATVMTYTATGKPLTATSGTVGWTYGYNKLDLPTGQTLSVDGYNWAIGYGYDINGALATTMYPDGKVVNYLPDAHGRPTAAGSYATAAAYYPDGELKSVNFGNGASYVAGKNSRNLLSDFAYGNAAALAVSEVLAYDRNANITQITDLTNNKKILGYDGLNRLTSATAAHLWGTESYSYDTLNNIRSLTTGGATNTYNYDGRNRLASITRGASPVSTFGYDNRGNVTNKNAMTLVFDQANRLTQITGLNGYLYDAEGRRVKKVATAGTATYYAYSLGGQLLWQYNQATTDGTDYIYLGKKMVASTVTDMSALRPDQVNITMSLVGVPIAVGTNVSVTVDMANHGTATLTSNSRDPVHLGARIINASGQVVTDVVHASIPDIAPGAHASVTVQVPAATIIDTGNMIQLVPLQEGVAWFDTWGVVPVVVGPFSHCTQASTYLCNTEYTLLNGEANVALAIVAGPALSADGTSMVATVDVQNNGIVNISGQGTHPVNLGNHLANAAGVTVTWDVTRVALPVVPPGGHAQMSIATPVNGGVGSGNRLQFELAHEGIAWFRDYGFGPITTASYGDLTAPSASNTGAYSVQWTAVPGAANYRLDEQVNAGAWTTVQTANALTWSTSGRVTGTYTYRMAPCGSIGCGTPGAARSVVVTLPPQAPAAISVPASSTGNIAIGWSLASYATSYSLEQSINGGAFGAIYNGPAVSYAYTATVSGTYTYRVRACNATGCSGYGPMGSSIIVVPPTSAPAISVPGLNNYGNYTVTWTGVGGATRYTLQEQANGGGWSTVQDNAAGSWSTAGRGNGTYGYRVQACNASGCGPWSGTASIVVALIPGPPTNVRQVEQFPNPKRQTMTVSWNAVALATRYEILDATTVQPFWSGTVLSVLVETGAAGAIPEHAYSVRACNANGCSAWVRATLYQDV